jgi:hypothetical protein
VLLGTCWGTHWEFEERFENNWMGTHWEQKRSNTSPTLPQKEKKNGHLECMLTQLIDCQEFLCLPLFFTNFFALANGMGTNSKTKVLLWKWHRIPESLTKAYEWGYKLLHLLGWKNPILASGRGVVGVVFFLGNDIQYQIIDKSSWMVV